MWLYVPARGNGDGDFFPVGGRLCLLKLLSLGLVSLPPVFFRYSDSARERSRRIVSITSGA